MLCLNCNKNKAIKDELRGYLYCKKCTQRLRGQNKPKETIEITTDNIKTDRKIYSDDILQPYRSGQLSKEYIQKYGTKNIVATKEEIKNAKNVWDDNNYYKKE